MRFATAWDGRPFPQSAEENGEQCRPRMRWSIFKRQRILRVAERAAPARPWWREWELGLLLLLAACFYTIRVTDLSIRGEESRRGRIAWEIWQTGDWIVPRIQGEPVFFRPPLQNWLIVLVGMRAEPSTSGPSVFQASLPFC